MGDVLVIGIAGGTGCGKSTITRYLTRTFGDSVAVLHHDSYYLPHHSMSYEERTRLNYDAPESLDNALFLQHLRELKAGKEIQCPVYDFTVHDRSDRTELLRPAKVILVEGILIFANEELCKEMDMKLFVDADADVRILRRVRRDMRDRGRSIDSIINQYLSTVKPMHEKYVEPSKKNADIIIPGGGRNKVAVDMVEQTIRAFLAG